MEVSAAASFIGTIPNEEVRRRMQQHDFVIVPSRHSYAEGLPNTICEGLASRSPLIVSDHPAFAGRLKPDRECAAFSASDPEALADCVARLCADQALYAALSANAPEALAGLHVGVEWRELMTMFLRDPRNSSGWVARHSLKALDP